MTTLAETLKKVSVGPSDGLFILHVPYRAHNSYKHVAENLFQRVKEKSGFCANPGAAVIGNVSRCWVRARGTCAEMRL
jgi:hypothetical protein